MGCFVKNQYIILLTPSPPSVYYMPREIMVLAVEDKPW